MFECSVIEDHGLKWVIVKGRIDALSSPEIEKDLNTIILSGERFILADLTEVSYISPAIKHPSVDFMINSHVNETLTYKFLYGFGFNGSYKYILIFEGKEGFVELNILIQILFHISHAKVIGMTILAESKGLLGHASQKDSDP